MSSIRNDLNNPFNDDADHIRCALDHNIKHVMFALTKEKIDDKLVATDLPQIHRLMKIAVSAGLSGQRLYRSGLEDIDKRINF